MFVSIKATVTESAKAAATDGADRIRAAIREKGEARIILATGASQFDMLKELVKAEGVDWSKCAIFHLDEYIGVSSQHPASFVKYLTERFIEKVPGVAHFEPVNGDAEDIDAELSRLGRAITKAPIDIAFVGIGENGHLAFNDPPADFETTQPYLRVALDQACREQQLGEGWFKTFDDVPKEAISMSVRQIMASKSIICTVPDQRKAEAVKNAVDGPVSNLCPASILQEHPEARLYLDQAAAGQLAQSDVDA